jgi:hypothetical protein
MVTGMQHVVEGVEVGVDDAVPLLARHRGEGVVARQPALQTTP